MEAKRSSFRIWLIDLSENRAATGRSRNGSFGERLLELLTIRVLSVTLFRLSQAAGRQLPVLGTVVKQCNHLLTGCDIAWRAHLGPGLVLFHPTGVVIGPFVVAGECLRVQQGVTLGGDGGADAGRHSSPRLGNRVLLGSGAKVFGGIEIGDDVRVGANAVVLKSVPANSIAVGVPAHILT